MIDNRSWKEVVCASRRTDGRATNKVDREIPVEVCCGNCGWKLNGTFRTIAENTTQTTHQAYGKPWKEVVGVSQQGMHHQIAEKGNSRQGVGDRRELGKGNITSNFEKSNSEKARDGPVCSVYRRSPITTKNTKEDITRQRILLGTSSATENKEQTVVNREVHRWVQKHNSMRDNQSGAPNEIGKGNKKNIQVYKRRGTTTNQRRNESIGVILREKPPTTGRKTFNQIEFIKKMKGVLSNEEGSGTEDEEESSFEVNWERGECSNQVEDEERLALIPISTAGEANSEGRSQASWETNESRRSLDIWSSLKGSALEEQARIWIMRNLGYMGKSLGLKWDGSKVKTLQITQGVEGRQFVEETTSKGSRGRTKVMREINRLKSEINYERSGSKSVRKRIKIGKVRKGSKVPC